MEARFRSAILDRGNGKARPEGTITMKKIINALVDHRIGVMAVMLALAVICGFFALRMPINRDRTKYLPDDSAMKRGLALMEDEFPEAEEKSAIRVMVDDLAPGEVPGVIERLGAIPGVSSVEHEDGSDKYRKGAHTLFVVKSGYDYGTEEELAIEDAIGAFLSGRSGAYKNNDMPQTEVPLWILAFAVSLAVLILLVMSDSWLDPPLCLLTLACAVAINYGTNAILPYIDKMTATVGPVLQLALSMDYFIILMNRYRREKAAGAVGADAMKAALAASVPSIASSALTTAAGLLALVFLSFKLGPELGIVLAKGVCASMLCALTVLPGLILATDRALERTRKRSPRVRMGLPAKWSYRARRAMPAAFAVLLVGAFLLQRATAITFTDKGDDPLADVFPRENTVVLLYRNDAEDRIPGLIAEIEKDKRVSALGYANTLGRALSAAEMADALQSLVGASDGGETAGGAPGALPAGEDLLRLVYSMRAGDETPALTAEEFLRFLTDDVLENEAFAGYVDEEMRENAGTLRRLADREALTTPMDSGEMAAFFGPGMESAGQLYMLYGMLHPGGSAAGLKLTPQEFVSFADDLLHMGNFAAYLDEGMTEGLRQARTIIEAVVSERTYTSAEMAELLSELSDGVSRRETDLLYLYYGSLRGGDPDARMTIPELMDYLYGESGEGGALAGFLDEETRGTILRGREELDAAAAQMKGETYSRVVLTSDYPDESPETEAYVAKLRELCGDGLGEYYLAGNSVMAEEMKAGFDREYLLITLVTAAAVYLVVLAAFCEPVMPLLLTLLVQCGVFLTVGVIGLYSGSMYYLALLIVQGILMGATIDYGIVFCHSYREKRRSLPVAGALEAAYEGSIHTIMTSGSILVLVLAALGLLSSAAMMSEVCVTLSIGALIAILLILMVLPGLVAACDRLIRRRERG